jgi:fructokinase
MIVCCGEALMDMVPDGGHGDAFLARPGGCAYNTAIAASRLGSPTRFLGRIGGDFFGETLVGRLAENGVDTSLVARSDQGATLAFVQRGPSGDARYAFYSTGAADRSFDRQDLPASLGGEARFLMVGSISMVQEPAASTIERLVERERDRTLVALDPNIRPSLIADRKAYLKRFLRWVSMASIVKASSEDLEWLFPELPPEGRALRLLAGKGSGASGGSGGAELVVETRGGGGAVARTRHFEVSAPAFQVEVADTIGAGDTFHAALLHRLDSAKISSREALRELDEASLRDTLVFAQAAAALDCTRTGAEPPGLGELREFLARRA